jgi:hypothetical protein
MKPRFFIIGDSHAGTLTRAARALDLDFAGGSIMAGHYMNKGFFKIANGRFEILSELGAPRLAKRLAEGGLGDNLLDLDMPILSTVGFNAGSFAAQFVKEGLAIAGGLGEKFISRACFEALVEDSRCGALEFYRALMRAGKTVYAVPAPQRLDKDGKIVFKSFEAIMIRHVSAMGVGIVDVRAETTGSDGVLLPQYASSRDRVHANDAFGEVVFGRFFEMLSREAQASCRPAGSQPARPAPRARRTSRMPASRPHR